MPVLRSRTASRAAIPAAASDCIARTQSPRARQQPAMPDGEQDGDAAGDDARDGETVARHARRCDDDAGSSDGSRSSDWEERRRRRRMCRWRTRSRSVVPVHPEMPLQMDCV